MKIRVGLGTWTEPKDRGPYATLNRHYVESVVRAGGLPLLLPVFDDPSLAADTLDAVDALILTGGTDVDPALYGQPRHPSVTAVDPLRDRWEAALLAEARRRRMPVLAICRGCQIVNVALGGTLHQDLPSQKPSPIRHVGAEGSMSVLTHGIRITAAESRLARVFGPRVEVNSFHHQAVDTLAPGLTATAWSDDGVLEAFEAPGDDFLVGVQFHPEALTGPYPAFTGLFRALLEAARPVS